MQERTAILLGKSTSSSSSARAVRPGPCDAASRSAGGAESCSSSAPEARTCRRSNTTPATAGLGDRPSFPFHPGSARMTGSSRHVARQAQALSRLRTCFSGLEQVPGERTRTLSDRSGGRPAAPTPGCRDSASCSTHARTIGARALLVVPTATSASFERIHGIGQVPESRYIRRSQA